jgi:hypothetical protein
LNANKKHNVFTWLSQFSFTMMSEQQQGNPHGNQPNLHDEDTLARD